MANGADSGQTGEPAWNPSTWTLSRRRRDESEGHPISVSLRHPTCPFVQTLDASDDNALKNSACDYLSRVKSVAGSDFLQELPGRWLDALRPGQEERGFGWLPIDWPSKYSSNPGVPASPLVSFRADRTSPSGNEQIAILLASEQIAGKFLGSGFGIRVVAHVGPPTNGKSEVRFTGMSASLPFGDYQKEEVWKDIARANSFLAAVLMPQIKSRIEGTLGLQEVALRGFRFSCTPEGEWQVKVRGTGLGKAGGRQVKGTAKGTAYSFVYLVTLSDAAQIINAVPVNMFPLVADATPGRARVFPRDPASQGGPGDLRWRRPTRSEKELDEFRVDERITGGPAEGLRSSLADGDNLRVVVCPGFVPGDDSTDQGDDNLEASKAVDLSGIGPAIRSNDFSAISAFKHVKQLFDRLDAYGISSDAYFRAAKLPLKVFYRAGIRPGPGKDGRTVNARVLPEHWPDDLVSPKEPGKRPSLEVHLALANLSHRGRDKRSYQGPSPAEPLGIAADARWIWHEIGHVLLMASTGELELRFVHSPGDALAAIVADPLSGLAGNIEARGRTFPWVFLPRRHDRCVSHGWSWGGSLHRAMSRSSGSRRKGYWTEQILSSSLFRLYLCLGGETTQVGNRNAPDTVARESASHYSVYLIMRGIQLLGSAGIVPADDPDHLISALIDADVGTGKWVVPVPAGSGQQFRIGGCAHKVIRWAFEAQGMYAPADKIINGPGLPPRVDVFIENHRSKVNAEHGGVQYGPGSYFPVSLHWDPQQRGSNDAPAWQATESAIEVSGGNIHVKVGNRGDQSATDVEVRVWWRQWPDGAEPPEWDGGSGWTECEPPAAKAQTIAARELKTFGPFSHLPPSGRYLVLAQATCADDRANIDTATCLPCSRQSTPLVDLVAGDNNLGLRVIQTP
jgi:hypothetical protein